MPLGTLTKFEVQPGVPKNAIVEERKGSEKLAAFGKPVPFNYGCFPQTYRDPGLADELYGAPGDDDPLDVIDIGDQAAGIGAIVQCRPIGAVCLIDEGRVDWKILVVNTELPGRLAAARSVDDVERLIPGRIQSCLRWIEELKSRSDATLHFEVHDAIRARSLIQGDNESWRQLVAKVGPDGTANGLWIMYPGQIPTRLQSAARLERF